MMGISFKLLATGFITLALAACGGGGGGGATTVVTPPIVATDYSCDQVATLASMPRTLPYSSLVESATTFPYKVATIERWALTIDGVAHQLNVSIARPNTGIPIKGVVIAAHGQSDTLATLSPTFMPFPYWDTQMTDRGYVSISVARRGNYGSTGNMYTSVDYSSGSSEMNYFKYQAASMVAAMDKMAKDPAYQPYMSTILLVGGSGGSDTVTQTAVDSAVFKAASKKAVIRFDGGVGTPITSLSVANFNAMNEYATLIAKQGVSSLWVVGDKDTLTSPSQVACQYKFYNQTAGYPNQFYVMPNGGHMDWVSLFSPELRQIFREYMVSRGFDGF